MNKLIGITRVRNEGLIIADTIRHFLRWCDHIVLYDDCSTDETKYLAKLVGERRLTVICGDYWRANRVEENTRHRKLLTEEALEMGADWCLCFDADERLVGELPSLDGAVSGYEFRLFDGYLTRDRQEVYCVGDSLSEVPRMWGLEYRDIIMLFRPDKAEWEHTGAREPNINGTVILAPTKVKHYGKCLSVEHWEETCRYYATHHPTFRKKWEARMGKAIHRRSDFDGPIFTWDSLMINKHQWVKI